MCSNQIKTKSNYYFYQVYTIHGVRQNNVIPLCFALLPNKRQETYTAMFNALKQKNGRLNPVTIMTDFEQAAMNAFKEVFPQTSMSGCFFHFGQCLWRKMHQFQDLQQDYKNDSEFALKIKMLTALAFIPPEDVIKSFELLTIDAFYSSSPNMISFIDYFEDTWIGQPVRRGRRREPKFGIRIWNCFYRVTDDIAKTNNSVEGWHRGFHSMLGSDHPTIWKLINGFKKEQSVNEVRILQYQAGQNPPPSRKRYRESACRLKSVVESYGTLPTEDYLKSIAHNLNIAV